MVEEYDSQYIGRIVAVSLMMKRERGTSILLTDPENAVRIKMLAPGLEVHASGDMPPNQIQFLTREEWQARL